MDLKREENIFNEVVELPKMERRRFLDEACAGEPALRADVEALLAAHEQSAPFFEEGAASLKQFLKNAGIKTSEIAAELTADEKLGPQTGHYKLRQKLGEGGCGEVYLAEQIAPVRRHVALKIIKPGMETKNVIARFELERQALAMMDHPNIAQVFDAGVTETGRPYFVMELVRGVKITNYCDEHQLNVRQRLELFSQVCHAIQHAHQKGVIHRDIKPSNILVTLLDGIPVPKVIDFGVAKATAAELDGQTFVTALGHLIGTPAYMSPEQAQMSGLDVDTRSDIYSLGVVLYELLAGQTPFDAHELIHSGLDEMRRTLRDKEPQRPSALLNTLRGTELTQMATHRRMEPLRLKSFLKGDLDWIVMKCLEKDRRRRYETANALAMDIHRFLSNEPVIARPPSRIYRLQKTVSRNKVAFASGIAVAAALIFGLGIATWAFLKEREARQRAEIGEKVTQAAFAVSQGRSADADRIILGISNAQPSLESAVAYRSLGEWHALHGRWREASDCFVTLLRMNRFAGPNAATLDLAECGAALAELGDQTRYGNFCEQAVSRFAVTADPVIAERVIKATLLLQAPPSFYKKLGPFSEALRHLVVADNGATNAISNLQFVAVGDATSASNLIAYHDNAATITAGGSDIGLKGDHFDHFVYQYLMVTNDFDFRLRVQSVIGGGGGFARTGLMARDIATNTSCHQIMVAVNAQKTFQVIVRTQAGSIHSQSQPPNPLPVTYGHHSWVRLQRVGTTFYTYYSDDGEVWRKLYQFDSASDADGPFANTLCLGIATSAWSTNQSVTALVSDFGATRTMPASAMLSLALLEYRSGNYINAVDWSRRCINDPDYQAARVATAYAILAMCSRHLHQNHDARSELAKSRDMIETQGLTENGSGSNTQGYWYDWISARVLLREAEQKNN